MNVVVLGVRIVLCPDVMTESASPAAIVPAISIVPVAVPV